MLQEQNKWWIQTRIWFRRIHLWLGLASSLVLTVVIGTGAIYVFRDEIIDLLNSDVIKVSQQTGERLMTHEEIVYHIEEATSGKVASISLPDNTKRAWSINIRMPEERGRGTNYYVNPYNGAYFDQKEARGYDFFFTMFKLHRWLLMDPAIGRPITGWSTIILSFLVITGLVIWLPKKVRFWYYGLKMTWRGNWKVFSFNFHKTLGFYASFFILLMALTGPQWSFSWYRTGLYKVLNVPMPVRGQLPIKGEFNSVDINSYLQKGFQPKSIQELISIADSTLPYKGSYRFSLAKETDPTITFTKAKSGFAASSGTDKIELNRFTGDIVDLDLFSNKSFNEKIASSIKAIHLGDVFGLFSKILFFISSVIATALPITGVVMWIDRMGRRRKRAAKI